MEPRPGWGIWFFIALPVCIISILLIWLLLLITFRPGRNTTIVHIRPMKDRFTGIQWFISVVTIATIVLWCLSNQLEGVFGDMGVIAIIPIVLFFGTGILTKEDFNNFLWTIIILAAGGLALGKAVNSSGLLRTIAVSITSRVGDLSLYSMTCVFAALIAVVATFISHTVAALIVLPLVREVGNGMTDVHLEHIRSYPTLNKNLKTNMPFLQRCFCLEALALYSWMKNVQFTITHAKPDARRSRSCLFSLI